MRALTKRLHALEHATGMHGGWDHTKPTHMILMDEHQPYGAALADYQARYPDKVAGADDNVMWIQLVSPEFDESGVMIPRTKRESYKGPTLGDVMNGAVQ